MENNEILTFLENMEVRFEKKLDDMGKVFNHRMDSHNDGINDLGRNNSISHSKLWDTITTIKERTAVLKSQMKTIGIISGVAMSGLISLIIILLTGGK